MEKKLGMDTAWLLYCNMSSSNLFRKWSQTLRLIFVATNDFAIKELKIRSSGCQVGRHANPQLIKIKWGRSQLFYKLYIYIHVCIYIYIYIYIYILGFSIWDRIETPNLLSTPRSHYLFRYLYKYCIYIYICTNIVYIYIYIYLYQYISSTIASFSKKLLMDGQGWVHRRFHDCENIEFKRRRWIHNHLGYHKKVMILNGKSRFALMEVP